MSNFTKGEWVIDSTDNSIGVAGSDGEIISYIAELYNEYRDPQEAGANARLIANAPEMYRILCAIQEYCQYEDIDGDIECDIWEVLCAIEGREAKI